jgi:hypothetical protein
MPHVRHRLHNVQNHCVGEALAGTEIDCHPFVLDETLPNVIMPAGYFKVILVNNTGVTLPATNNNTLKFYTTPTQY